MSFSELNTNIDTELKLKPDVKKLWVEALRSGEYPQGRYTLKSTKGEYCCLGVLCDISKAAEWSTKSHISLFHYYDSRDNFPPLSVIKWAVATDISFDESVLNCVPGILDKNCERVFLSQLNDSNLFTFDQIADIIEYFY